LTAVAPDIEELRELDEDTRQAWCNYSEQLRELTGAEYERVEAASWTELQAELHRLDLRREELTAPAA
jgi:hypothetical protein